MLLLLPLLCASLAAASTLKPRHLNLQRRDDTVCTDLSVSTNNGDRKVAIVIDSSGSMAYNDPSDLRIAAGRALNEFLISKSEAGGSQKADLVTVIDFDDAAYLDYPLGDPAGANSSFDKVDSTGGTYIALGVNMAIDQLTSGGGATDKRSAIVVFTDGEDYNTDELVDAINNATAAGIRVSFGFLDTTASTQPPAVLAAVKNSRGVYATITVAAGSQNFINYVLLNGLTYNDNPQGYDSQLLAGLAETHFVTGSDTVSLKYSAQKGERVNFTVTSISAGFLDVSAVMGGKQLNSTNVTYGYSIVDVKAPGSGDLDLQVTAKGAVADSMFSVITNSNTPFKNCTVGVGGGGGGGLSAGGKAGVGIGVTVMLLGLGALGGYFAYKHFMGGGGGSNAVPPSGGESNTVQYMGDGGVEKMVPQTNVYPVDSMAHALPPGDAGQTMMAQSGSAGPMSGPPPAPQSMAAPPPGMQPTTAPMGAPPTSGLPPTGGPPTSGLAPTGGLPGSGMPLTGAPAVPSSMPMAFIPPLVPPNALNPNNTAPRGKGPGGAAQSQSGPAPPQGGHGGQYQTMKDFHPGNNFGQQMAPPGQQPMGPPGGAHPMSPGSPESQAFSGPAGSGGYPPAPQSQAPFGYPGDAHTMAPGTASGSMGTGAPPAPGSHMPFGPGADGTMNAVSPGSSGTMSPGGPQPFSPSSQMSPGGPYPGSATQMPFAHGGQPMAPPGSHGTGGYPPAPSSQASPAPGSQYAPGLESYQHGAGPNAYQGPMGHGAPGQAPGNSYQTFSGPGNSAPMTGADGYAHTMAGPGGQHVVSNPMGSDPNFNSYPSGQPMNGADGYNHTMQSHADPNTYHQNGSMSDSYHQSGQPMHTGTGVNPSGADMYHHSHPPPDPSSQSGHPDPSSQSNPSGQDMSQSHQTDWTDYHDPDACSCSEGPGADSDTEDNFSGTAPTPGTATTSDPGFYMPGAPFRPADKPKPTESGDGGKHKHRRRRFPRLARSRVESHHHHEWTGRDQECVDPECVFNKPGGHVCDGRECGCKCRDGGCEVYKRRLREARARDGAGVGVLG